MAHRAKHRRDALLRRVMAGRKIKTDRTKWGNVRYGLALADLLEMTDDERGRYARTS